MTELVISARGLCRHYSQGPLQVEVLRGVDLALSRGESLAIIGSSGSGKTTLLNCLGTLNSPTRGEVRVLGVDPYAMAPRDRARLRNTRLGFLYQFHHLLPEFSALENVAMPLLLGGLGWSGARQRAADLLARVGLAERLEHRSAELSGGERQRVALARALVADPDCVLLDEPTGDLDQANAERVQALIGELVRESGAAFLVATHNQALARSMDRVMRLESGRLVPLAESEKFQD